MEQTQTRHATQTSPLTGNWTIEHLEDSAELATASRTATATEVNALLAQFEVVDIGPPLVPYLAAAAAELALVAGIPWRFSVDDAPVALLRLIAKVSAIQPASSGPHTGRLSSHLIQQLLQLRATAG